jgi:hypothetical protein
MDSAVAMSASSAAALQWLVSPAPTLPSATGRRRIGESDIDAIQQVVRSYRELDNRLGGGRMRGAVVQYLNSEVTPLLVGGRFNADTGTRLATVGAELAQLAGWMAYDTGLHGHAQRYLTLALSFARHAGNSGLGAEVLAAKAHQAVYLARPAEAVDLARAAQATARRDGLPTLLAECSVIEAHAHAANNDARACAQALSGAEAAFGRAVRANDPAWLSYFDEAYLAARMGHCFRALGEPVHAERYARRSLNMDGRFVRGKAFNLSLLATALAEQDDIEQACAVGQQALVVTAGLRSARSVRYIKDLQSALRHRADAAAPCKRSMRRWLSACPEHQRMLDADDRARPENLPAADHRGRLIEGNPADRSGLICRRLPHKIRASGQVEILRKVGIADHRLVGEYEAGLTRAPPGFFLRLADGICRTVFPVVDVSPGQFPHPFADDETVPPHKQDM